MLRKGEDRKGMRGQGVFAVFCLPVISVLPMFRLFGSHGAT